MDVGMVQKWADIDRSARFRVGSTHQYSRRTARRRRCQLYIRPPDGAVEVLSLSRGVARWVDRFRFWGVSISVGDQRAVRRVVHLFSVYVDQPPGKAHSYEWSRQKSKPNRGERWVSKNSIAFGGAGSAPVKRFALFDEVARQHSAYMASYGRAVHQVPRVTEGVSWAT